MSTWVLTIFLAYAGDIATGGGVALSSSSRDFYHREECLQARKEQIDAFREAGFKRYAVTCAKRSGPLLEPVGGVK